MTRRRPRHRRTRPHPARQRLRHHRRRRLAPRFHRQLALLQHRRLLDLGLLRRRRRHLRAASEADRRSGTRVIAKIRCACCAPRASRRSSASRSTARPARPFPSLRELLGSVPPARLFDETLKLFLTGHGAMSLTVLRRHGLLGELLPTVAGYLDRHPEWRGGAAGAAGPGQHRSARGRGQTRDADVPVRVAAVRADRRDHREAAAGEVARHRHHRRCRRPRGAQRAGPHLDSEALLAGRARDVRRAAAARTAARPARVAHAGAAAVPRRASTCCCCARTWAWPRASSRTGGRRSRKSRRPIATAWPIRSVARRAGRRRRRWRRRRQPARSAPPASRRTRTRARGLMNAAADCVDANTRWLPAYVGGGQQSRRPRGAGQPRTAGARPAAGHAAGS